MNLGYAVTDKYKQYTHQLVEAYKKGEDIETIDLASYQQWSIATGFLKM